MRVWVEIDIFELWILVPAIGFYAYLAVAISNYLRPTLDLTIEIVKAVRRTIRRVWKPVKKQTFCPPAKKHP